jgi:hypothetical protein
MKEEKNTTIPADKAFNSEESLTLPPEQKIPNPADWSDAELSYAPMIQESAARERQAQKEKGSSLQGISQTFSELANLPRAAVQMEEEAGIPEMRTDVSEIDSLIAMKSQGLRRELQSLEGQNVPVSFIRGQQNKLNIQATRELADLSMVRDSKLGRLQAAEQWVERKTAAETQALSTRLQYLQFVYGENKDILNKEQDKQFQMKISETESRYNAEKEKRIQINNMALQAAQFGADADAVSAIGNAQSFNEALSTAGKYLGEPFRLQVENQKFAQWATRQQVSQGWKSLEMQEQAADTAANQAVLAMSKEAKDELLKTQAYENWETRGLVAGDLDGTLTEFAGTAVRDNVNWQVLARNDSAVNAIATQLVYSRNPQLKRAMELGDEVASADIKSQAAQIKNSMLKGQNIQPDMLKDRVREIDTNYASAVRAKNAVVEDILIRNPGAILPGYSVAEIVGGAATKALDDEVTLDIVGGGLEDLLNSMIPKQIN